MTRLNSPLANDRGAALIVSILILALLTVIGISATTTSTIEVQIAGNEKAGDVAFYRAEGGWQHAIHWLDTPVTGVIEDCGSNTDPNIAGGDPFCPQKYGTADVLNNSYRVDILYNGGSHIPGYSTDFMRFGYTVSSTGDGPAGAESLVQVNAGRIFNVAGY